MPLYPFECQQGHTSELRLPADQRDEPQLCSQCETIMVRKMSVPMAVNWTGRFQGRWHKVQEGEW